MPAGVICTVNDSVATKYQRAAPADPTVKKDDRCTMFMYPVSGSSSSLWRPGPLTLQMKPFIKITWHFTPLAFVKLQITEVTKA